MPDDVIVRYLVVLAAVCQPATHAEVNKYMTVFEVGNQVFAPSAPVDDAVALHTGGKALTNRVAQSTLINPATVDRASGTDGHQRQAGDFNFG